MSVAPEDKVGSSTSGLTGTQIGLIVGFIVGFAVLFAALAGFMYYRKQNISRKTAPADFTTMPNTRGVAVQAQGTSAWAAGTEGQAVIVHTQE